MPQSAGMFWKNLLKASSPPAEAPIPTTAQIGSLPPTESTEDFARCLLFPTGWSTEDLARLLFFLRMDGIREVPGVAISSLPPVPSRVKPPAGVPPVGEPLGTGWRRAPRPHPTPFSGSQAENVASLAARTLPPPPIGKEDPYPRA